VITKLFDFRATARPSEHSEGGLVKKRAVARRDRKERLEANGKRSDP